MSDNTTPQFEDGIVPDETVETEEVNDGDVPETGEDHDLDLEVNDDANLDVDVPDETDEVEDTAAAAEKPAKASSSTKAPRTKAPEGYVKPVEFAKILSGHLGKTVPPQVVYSYIKNNAGDGAKNPFPVHSIEGYDWYVKPDEGIAWWDAKNTRVAASKTARAEKAAAKASKTEAVGTETEPQGEVVEAE
jgi:hypothetical protein